MVGELVAAMVVVLLIAAMVVVALVSVRHHELLVSRHVPAELVCPLLPLDLHHFESP